MDTNLKQGHLTLFKRFHEKIEISELDIIDGRNLDPITSDSTSVFIGQCFNFYSNPVSTPLFKQLNSDKRSQVLHVQVLFEGMFVERNIVISHISWLLIVLSVVSSQACEIICPSVYASSSWLSVAASSSFRL
jgi:hypothetical protein